MKSFKISQAKTANVEVAPANVTLNVTNVRPYTRTEMKKFSDVIKKSIHAYELQVVKDCGVRLECIERIASQRFENMNLFWTLFMQRADVLLDSRRFVKEAKECHVDPILLATNIVAHGSGLVNKVASHGIRGSQIRVEDFQCSFVPETIIQRFMEHPEEFYPPVEEEEIEERMNTIPETVPTAPIAKTTASA